MGWRAGQFVTKAGLIDDSPLPKWLRYNATTRTLDGVAMPGDDGEYQIKIYAMDKNSNIAFLTFKLTIVDRYVLSINVRGLNRSRQTTVMKSCNGSECTDSTLDDVQVFAPARPPREQ